MRLLIDWAGMGFWRVMHGTQTLARVRELEVRIPCRTCTMGTQKGFIEVEGRLTLNGEHGVID